MHEALGSFTGEGPWTPRWPAPPALVGDQLCHGDVGFGNVVFSGRQPVAFIDFEFVVRADPLLDVATLAGQWTPVPRSPEEDTDDRWARAIEGVAAVASGYGLEEGARRRLPAALVAVEARAADYVEARLRDGDAAAREAVDGGVLARRAHRRRWLEDHAADVERVLTEGCT